MSLSGLKQTDTLTSHASHSQAEDEEEEEEDEYDYDYDEDSFEYPDYEIIEED